jgi:hypothetical protein
MESVEISDPSLPRAFQKLLEERDERILALELLLVDQASRLLAVEAILSNLPALADLSAASINAKIDHDGKRFLSHFESITGFLERAKNLSGQLLQAAIGAREREAK